ncbi:MAG TPA: DNA-3-methyladenine glycosylase 2 family protein [Candidatus Dormibacteraeota bacterium]|nr:DNA-3-methyladenine glycosylase 2 family protein [Candidatus Dormibacteraeota bacterium]
MVHGAGFARTATVGRDEAWRASRTADGPATTRFLLRDDEVLVHAWGPGAAIELERAPQVLGEDDDRGGFAPAHPLLRELDRRMPGLRITRSGAVLEALVPVIMEQKVIGAEARAGYSRLLRAVSNPAPGPGPGSLLLPPAPERLAAMPYWAFHPFALERRRAETVMRVAQRARWLEAGAGMELAVARARLQAIPGIGPWTAAEVAIVALGDADAVSVGDYHVPNLVSWALAGEPRGDDARMLELLEPYRGHRGRVVRLLEAAGMSAPRRGPRLALRHLERA